MKSLELFGGHNTIVPRSYAPASRLLRVLKMAKIYEKELAVWLPDVLQELAA
jgi:hypothetical protein